MFRFGVLYSTSRKLYLIGLYTTTYMSVGCVSTATNTFFPIRRFSLLVLLLTFLRCCQSKIVRYLFSHLFNFFPIDASFPYFMCRTVRIEYWRLHDRQGESSNENVLELISFTRISLQKSIQFFMNDRKSIKLGQLFTPNTK